MKNLFIILIVILSLSSCGGHKTEESVAKDTIETQVTLTDAQYKSANIAIGKLETRELSTTLKLNGKIDVPPQNMVSVSTPFGGFLKRF